MKLPDRYMLRGFLILLSLLASVLSVVAEPRDSTQHFPEKYRTRTTLETIAYIPGQIAYAPLKYTVLGLGYTGVYLVESGFVRRMQELFSGTGLAPVYAPRTGAGVTFFTEHFLQRESFLFLTATTWLDYRQLYHVNWMDVRLFRDALHSDYSLRYRSLTDEEFFGIGPYSREEDAAVFAQEDVLFEVTLRRNLSRTLAASVDLGVSNTSIFESRINNDPSIIDVYNDSTLAGLTESIRLQGVEFSLKYDDTNHSGHPTAGRIGRIGTSLFTDFDDDRFSFYKFSADLTQYLHLFYDRTLVLRVAGETTEGIDNPDIPFYHLAELGRYETIRGFPRGRFRDKDYILGSAEYRYPIWIPWAKTVDAAMFIDAGQVSDNVFQHAAIPDLQVGYGGGFRFYGANGLIAKTEIAFTKEGYRFYLILNS